MKIGIITFQRAHNFGAQMQMYALYNFLRTQNYDVWILDYHCSAVEDDYKLINPLKPYSRFIRKNVLAGLLDFIKSVYSFICGYQKKKVESFESFLNDNFQLTKRFEQPEDMPIDFDVLITGSDQVWNYQITRGRHKPYFLDNGKNEDVFPLRISYAPSCEYYAFQQLEKDKLYLNSILSKFYLISAREKVLCDFLEDTINVKADEVLDPTLLLNQKDYLKIARRPNKDHYLCVYKVSHSKEMKKVAKKIAKEKGLEIIEIYASTIANDKKSSYGPIDILSYLCYADVIVTSSFHGTTFSIINRKDFYSVYDKPSSRVSTLLSHFGLDNRMVTPLQPFDRFSHILYNEELIKMIIDKSSVLLLNSIK